MSDQTLVKIAFCHGDEPFICGIKSDKIDLDSLHAIEETARDYGVEQLEEISGLSGLDANDYTYFWFEATWNGDDDPFSDEQWWELSVPSRVGVVES